MPIQPVSLDLLTMRRGGIGPIGNGGVGRPIGVINATNFGGQL